MEKYGTIPKRFTKEWWDYFWEYYKWHTVGAVGVIFLLTITVFQIMSNEKYDLILTYIGEVHYQDTSNEEISEALGRVISDANSDGKQNVMVQVLQIVNPKGEVENAEYRMAFEAKKLLELQAGDGFLFLFDEEQMNDITEKNVAPQALMPVSEWAGEAAEGYFVRLGSTQFFKDCGFETGDG